LSTQLCTLQFCKCPCSLSLSTTHLKSKSSVWGFLPLTSK
jgi:hypothetical protein